ncbi:MAG TPA: ATP-binding cassette domain-containing protein, partial [Candidatus Sulfotelmatobacter sp.]|nr:ATP-binding cassette domain-containing protein [Candidatus Sulfotelmatobacter sp.]
MNGDATAVRAVGLGRRFGAQWALRGVDLELARGEVFGLLGPNGAGKTTTVRLLAALIAPSEGRAWVDGHDVVAEADAVRARIGVLTETPGLYERLTAVQNLQFFGRLHGLPLDVRRQRIERLLRLFELWDRRDGLVGTFSKGMKQKLAIARALLHEPSVLFLDEPTAALDPEAAFVVREAIAALKGQGRTIVLCTHNLDEAERLCDRIGFLRATLLRLDSPAGLRGPAGEAAIEVELAAPPPDGTLDRLRERPEVRSATLEHLTVEVQVHDVKRDTPGIVRAMADDGAAILGVHAHRASLEDVYFEVRAVRAPLVVAVIGRESREIVRNRLLVASIVLPPIVLTVAPVLLVALGLNAAPSLPADQVAQLVARHPSWVGLDGRQIVIAFAISQFLATFLILPAYIPLAIASYSIVGEKQTRSLEAVLSTPIRTSELLAGKAVAALVPGILASWLAYGTLLLLTALLVAPELVRVITDPAWLAGVLVLGPAIGLISVEAGMI